MSDTVKRTTLLLVASLAVFGGAYGITAIVLPDPPITRGGDEAPAELPVPRGGGSGDAIGPSEGVSFRIYDRETNVPVAEVRVGSYRRTSETEVALADVTIGIVAQGGARVVIGSPGGTVRVDPPAPGREERVDADALAAADRARLRDVTLSWYETAAAAAAGEGASLVASLDNLVFDGARQEVRTGDTTIDGRTVLGGDVPVIIRGDDLDFDGRGLVIVWDEQHRRPARLLIPGGGEVVLKRPPDALPVGLLPGDTRQATVPVGGPMLADAEGTLPAGAIEPSTRRRTPYGLSVGGPIVGEQAGVRVLEAAAASGVVPLVDDAALGEPAAAEPADLPPAPRSPDGSEAPSTQRAGGAFSPVVVRWPGPFELVAQDDAETDGLRVRLSESDHVPRVRVTLADGSAEADALIYDEFEGLRLEGRSSPARVTQPGDGQVLGPLITFDAARGEGAVIGAGSAVLPRDEDEPATLVFDDRCDFRLDEAGRGLRFVEAQGDVRVDDEQLRLRARRLALTLSDDGEIESASVDGDVRAVLLGDDETRLTAPSVRLASADGVTELVATGAVRVERAEGTITGRRLQVEIVADAAEPLRRLVVEEDVELVDAEGRTIRGQSASIVEPGGPVLVTGDADRPATLIARPEPEAEPVRIESQTLVLDPEDESLAAPAAGRLAQVSAEGVRRELSWTNSLAATSERVDVVGGVRASGPSSAEPDAAEVLVAAGRAAVLLEDGEPASVEASETVRMTAERRESGRLLLSLDLRAERVTGDPRSTAFAVPVPGRVLVRDLRGRDEEGGGFAGVAAVEWRDRLDYDPSEASARLAGGVKLAARPTDAPAFDIDADVMVVRVSDGEGDRPGFDGAEAIGDARLTADAVSLVAGTLRFDPKSNQATATGGDGGVRVFDQDGRPAGRFRLAVYDVATGQLVRVEDLVAGG